MFESNDRDISQKGVKLYPLEIYCIALQAVENSGLYTSVFQAKLQDYNNERFVIFHNNSNTKAKEYHLIFYPAYTSLNGMAGYQLNDLIESYKSLVKSKQIILETGSNLHIHYFICQTDKDFLHFVYG